MAYAAVISLKQTILHLLNSCPISVVSSNREILDNCAYQKLTSLQKILKKSDVCNRSKTKLKGLDGEIREVLDEIEDSLELHASTNSEEEVPLEDVWEEMNSLIEALIEAVENEEDYSQDLENPNNLAVAVPSRGIDVNMVGLSDIFTDFKDHLMRIIRPCDFGFFSFFGLAGTGRSVLARSVYDDIEPSFECRAWVRIGPTYQLKQILVNIIAQIINHPHEEVLFPEELAEEELSEYLHSSLRGTEEGNTS